MEKVYLKMKIVVIKTGHRNRCHKVTETIIYILINRYVIVNVMLSALLIIENITMRSV